MNITADQQEQERVIDGATKAVDAMVDGVCCAVVVVAVRSDGHAYKIWSDGEQRVIEDVTEALMTALPIAVAPKHSIDPQSPDSVQDELYRVRRMKEGGDII